MRARKIILLTTLLLVALLAYWIYSSIRGSGLSARLVLEVAPKDSKIILNNKEVKSGLKRVKPGQYTVIFRRAGFSDNRQDVQVGKNDSKYVGSALNPNSQNTNAWYDQHPDDAKVAEGISSKSFDRVTSDQRRKMPLLQFLPHEERYFSIYSGASKKFPDDPTSVALYVRSYDAQDRRLAMQWIESNGANPTDFEIIFMDIPNPFNGVSR